MEQRKLSEEEVVSFRTSGVVKVSEAGLSVLDS